MNWFKRLFHICRAKDQIHIVKKLHEKVYDQSKVHIKCVKCGKSKIIEVK